jgi:hypothetical protein
MLALPLKRALLLFSLFLVMMWDNTMPSWLPKVRDPGIMMQCQERESSHGYANWPWVTEATGGKRYQGAPVLNSLFIINNYTEIFLLKVYKMIFPYFKFKF